MFPASKVEYLEAIELDHRPGVIKIRHKIDKGFIPFRFDSRLCEFPEIQDVILKSWNDDHLGTTCSVMKRIQTCRRDLSLGKCTHSTKSARRIKELTSVIDKAHTDGVTSLERIHELRKGLLQAHIQEGKYWKLKE